MSHPIVGSDKSCDKQLVIVISVLLFLVDFVLCPILCSDGDLI